jgi:hypothetical protein
MDNATVKPETVNPNFTLSARQEQLLFAALNSNKASNVDNSYSQSAMAPGSFIESPLQAPGSGTLGFEEGPFIDYEYEFDADGSYDYDFANGECPPSSFQLFRQLQDVVHLPKQAHGSQIKPDTPLIGSKEVK